MQAIAVLSYLVVEVRVITDVIVKAAGMKGQGVFALRDFTPGEFIFRRRYGRIVRNDQIETLSADDQRHLCELDWERSAVLLPPGCYLNHACAPNAMRKGVKVFAWKPIQAGEEVTIDYRLNAFTSERWDCVCGSANCQGSVTSSFFTLSEAQQAAFWGGYAGYFQDPDNHLWEILWNPQLLPQD